MEQGHSSLSHWLSINLEVSLARMLQGLLASFLVVPEEVGALKLVLDELALLGLLDRDLRPIWKFGLCKHVFLKLFLVLFPAVLKVEHTFDQIVM